MNIHRRSLLKLPLAGLLRPALFGSPGVPASEQEFRFGREHVMGTSLDLTVSACSDTQAEKAEAAVLNEIARLSQVLSTYDLKSEASRLNAAQGPFPISSDLFDVLAAYQDWGRRSDGALTSGAAFDLDPERRTATRVTRGALNIDAIGKAWVLAKAAEAARRVAGGVVLNIGGDIAVSSANGDPVQIEIADPRNHYDNAPALTGISLSSGAVATSGTSMRGNHIIDPRTGIPAKQVASVTVVAGDAVTANALATAACVLGPKDGLAFVARTRGAECLMIGRDGAQSRSAGFAKFEYPASDERARLIPVQVESNWPAEFSITMELPLTASGWRRPYTAVWAEDMKGRLVRNIAVFASKPRYLNDLRSWYDVNSRGNSNWRSVTRPTRGPGRYSFVWDGLDDNNAPVPQGHYRISVECVMEHGDYYKQSAMIACMATPASATIRRTGYFDEVEVQYGPKPGRV